MGKNEELPKEDIPVSETDEMTVVGGPYIDRTRKLGEYKATNTPLSAEEIRRRRDVEHHSGDWEPRTTENIAEVNPLDESEPEREEEWPDGA